MNRVLILVSYYSRNIDEIYCLIESFDRQVGIKHQNLMVVDNGGILPIGKHFQEGLSVEVILGSNKSWEFSGWLEGLKVIVNKDFDTITLLNDSYLRNWSITPASSGLIRSMFKSADLGKIACWMDNFSYFQRPCFSRKTNSRIVVIPSSLKQIMESALMDLIKRCEYLSTKKIPLFDKDELACLQNWIMSQHGRWCIETIPSRMQRIFLEHHLFDKVPATKKAIYPNNYATSLIYAVLRRIFNERR